MPQSITQKPLAEITWADLQALIDDGTCEGPTLEFKHTLADPDWNKGSSEISEKAKEELFKEVVAFANTYGGLLLVGVGEDSSNPAKPASKLSPMQRVADMARRLDASLRSRIEPPLAGLETRAIVDPANPGHGVLAIKVASSLARPHGFGKPAISYERRGASSEPMTMRDLQSSFWDGRTRRERIEQIRAKHQAELEEAVALKPQGQLLRSNGVPMAKSMRGMFLRVTAIAHEHLSLIFDKILLNEKLILHNGNFFGTKSDSIFPTGIVGSRWIPRAHGIHVLLGHSDDDVSHWTIIDDGTINFVGYIEKNYPVDHNYQDVHDPDDYVLIAAQVLSLCELLRNHANKTDTVIELDISANHNGNIRSWSAQNTGHGAVVSPPLMKHIEIGPFSFGPSADMSANFLNVETQIYRAFGRSSLPELRNFPRNT
jgi:Putative DNA-binding domain